MSVYAVGLLPLIVIAENQIEFRTLPATSCFGLLLFLTGVKYFIDKFLMVRGAVFLISFTFLLSLLNYSHVKVNSIFVDSFRQNNNFIKSTYVELNSLEPITVLVDFQPWPQKVYIGSLSVQSDLQMPWVPIGEISQVLGLRENQLLIRSIDGSEKNLPGNTIDLRKFRQQLTRNNH
jgi:hypothetical protein